MNINFTNSVRGFLLAFFLLILPWIVIIVGLIFNVENAWYYTLAITWFGSGIVFFGAIN